MNNDRTGLAVAAVLLSLSLFSVPALAKDDQSPTATAERLRDAADKSDRVGNDRGAKEARDAADRAAHSDRDTARQIERYFNKK